MLHVVGRHDMVFSQILAKILEQTVDKRTLSATSHHADGQSVSMNLCHQVQYALHHVCLGQRMKLARLLIVHTLGLHLINVASLLSFYHHADGVHTAGSLCGIGIVYCHPDTKRSHGFLPGHGMVRHRVIEHAVHIEKHGFGAKCLKTVFL